MALLDSLSVFNSVTSLSISGLIWDNALWPPNHCLRSLSFLTKETGCLGSNISLENRFLHLYEGLKIVREIHGDTELKNAVDASGAVTRKCFATAFGLPTVASPDPSARASAESSAAFSRGRLPDPADHVPGTLGLTVDPDSASAPRFWFHRSVQRYGRRHPISAPSCLLSLHCSDNAESESESRSRK